MSSKTSWKSNQILKREKKNFANKTKMYSLFGYWSVATKQKKKNSNPKRNGSLVYGGFIFMITRRDVENFVHVIKANFSFITFQKWAVSISRKSFARNNTSISPWNKFFSLATDYRFAIALLMSRQTFQRTFLIAERTLLVFVVFAFFFVFIYELFWRREENKIHKLHCNSSEKPWIIDEFNNQV